MSKKSKHIKKEVFSSKEAANTYKKASKNVDIAPTVIAKKNNICYIEKVNLDYSPSLEDYIKVAHGILIMSRFGIYNFDIKKEHIGNKQEKTKFIDWGDSYFIKDKNEKINICYPPENLANIIKNKEKKNLKNLLEHQIKEFLKRNL